MNDVVIRWLIAVALAHLAGSIPFGLLIGLTRGVDIRKHGSGNIGATNAGRVLGARLGALCFALDVGKGALPVLLAGLWMGTLGDRDISPAASAWWLAVAAAAILGHMFPVWLGFKGGKGVATGLGALAAMWPAVSIAATLALGLWLLSVRLTRYVGVSSCAAAASLPIFLAFIAAWIGPAKLTPMARVESVWPALAFTAALACVIVWRHRGNIARTLAGTEPRTTLLGGGGSTDDSEGLQDG